LQSNVRLNGSLAAGPCAGERPLLEWLTKLLLLLVLRILLLLCMHLLLWVVVPRAMGWYRALLLLRYPLRGLTNWAPCSTKRLWMGACAT